MTYADDEDLLTNDDELNAEAEATRAEIAKRVADALRTHPMPEGVGPLYAQSQLDFFADFFRAATAAALAFFARAIRCAAVIVSSARRPPMAPPRAPCSRK